MSITVKFQRSKRISTNMNIITSPLGILWHYRDSCYYRWITIFIFLFFIISIFLEGCSDRAPWKIRVLENRMMTRKKISYFLVLLWWLACCLFAGRFLVAVVEHPCSSPFFMYPVDTQYLIEKTQSNMTWCYHSPWLSRNL